jgi:DNA-binding GntR family transcriptional regulator
VTAAAIEHLREQIVGGSVDPGETLPESRVGEMLGVSRAPICEALTLLEREGLVEFDRRGTARVCEFDLDFHRLIFAAAGNKRLTRAWENLLSQISLVMRRFHESLEQRVQTSTVRDMTIRTHTELFQAIRSGLPDEAEALARQHTTYWLSEFRQSKAFAIDGIPSTVYDQGIVRPKEPNMRVQKSNLLPLLGPR